MSGANRPGSDGEHVLQDQFGTTKRANAFYDNQVLAHLTPLMREFLERMTMCFLATSDAHGENDNSFRAGPPGFVRVIDEKTVMWPEYKGNGVMASMGNITENPYVGMLFVDFFETQVGLHVNGSATVVENSAVEAFGPLFDRLPFATELATSDDTKKTPERWVVVQIDEAYIHCSKHIPALQYKPEGEDSGRRAGDVFKAKNGERSWLQPVCEVPEVEPEPEIGTVRFAQPPARRPFSASSGAYCRCGMCLEQWM